MRLLSVLLSAVILCASLAWSDPASSDEGHQHALTESELGSVHFATSCSKAARAASIARSRCCIRSSTSRRDRRSAKSLPRILRVPWRNGASP